MQYSFFSVISGFRHKTVHPFRHFLAVLPPPTLYKAENRKKNLDTCDQLCLWREGRGWACQCKLENALEMQSVSRLWSMIVDPSKSVGMRDNIPSRLLRLSTPSITDEVTHLINYSGHPMDLFLKISVLHANFCWLGDVEEIIVLGRKVLLGKR